MWMVQLAGDTSILAELSQSLTSEEIKVWHDGPDYILTSDRFASSNDAGEVRRKAADIVDVLNGASRLALDATQSIRVVAVYHQREDGRREMFIFPEPANARFGVISPTVIVANADGTTEVSHPADPVKEWAGLSLVKDAVADVFRLLAGGTPDWVNLYRIFEIISSDVGGLDVIARNGWATKASMSLFKHTANSPGALGLDARHGVETTQPPTNPMTISEAHTLISSLVHEWLRSQTNDLGA